MRARIFLSIVHRRKSYLAPEGLHALRRANERHGVRVIIRIRIRTRWANASERASERGASDDRAIENEHQLSTIARARVPFVPPSRATGACAKRRIARARRRRASSSVDATNVNVTRASPPPVRDEAEGVTRRRRDEGKTTRVYAPKRRRAGARMQTRQRIRHRGRHFDTRRRRNNRKNSRRREK